MDASGEERFVGVDIAQAGDTGLVQQKRLDRAIAVENFLQLGRGEMKRFGAQAGIAGRFAHPADFAEAARVAQVQFGDVLPSLHGQDHMGVGQSWRCGRMHRDPAGHAKVNQKAVSGIKGENDALTSSMDMGNSAACQAGSHIDLGRLDEARAEYFGRHNDGSGGRWGDGVNNGLYFRQFGHIGFWEMIPRRETQHSDHAYIEPPFQHSR